VSTSTERASRSGRSTSLNRPYNHPNYFINTVANNSTINPTDLQTYTTTHTIDPNGKETIQTTTTVRSISTKPILLTTTTDIDIEPIRLSKFSGGYEPNPEQPRKIDTLDWPAPPYPAAVPELRARSRSSSNRHAPSTIHSVRGGDTSNNAGAGSEGQDPENEESSDEDELEDQEVKDTLMNNQMDDAQQYQEYLRLRGATTSSVSSSLARAKASRPNSRLRYQNNLFDNDYNDYLLRYKSDKEFRKILNSNKRSHSGESENEKENKNDEVEEVNDEDDDEKSPKDKELEIKIKKDIEEISKIEKESSMAAAVLQELKAQEKMLSRKLKIDPWKASRAPSARVEPHVKTRYESPVNACK
jgi:hypothetical protein